MNRQFSRCFSSARPVYSAPIPKFGLTAKKAPKGPRTKQKGVPGASKTFFEYVNSKLISQKAPKLSDLPIINESIEALVTSEIPGTDTGVVKYDGEVLKRLHYIGGAFKKGQYNELFSEKITILRDETVDICKKLTSAEKMSKFVITGDSGVGKSSLITQIQSFLLSRPDTIVLNIPILAKTIDGSYAFDFNKTLDLYESPMLLKKVMTKFAKSNKTALQSIPISKSYNFNNVRFTPETTSLYDMFRFPVKVPQTQYSAVFEDLLECLKASNYKLYLTVDDFNILGLSEFTSYKNTEFQSIPFLKFHLHRRIFDILEGKLGFKGVVLGTSGLFKNTSSFMVPLGLEEKDVFDEEFNESLSALQGSEVVKLGNLTKNQVKQLVRWQINNGLLIEQDKEMKDEEIDLEKVSDQKYFLSGGNPRELYKACNMLYY